MSQIHAGQSAPAIFANDAEWDIRPYRESDLPALVGLINSIDAAYKLGEGTSEENFLQSMSGPRSDPQRQIVVAEPRDGTAIPGVRGGSLLGAARAGYEDDEEHGERIYYVRVWLSPGTERLSLGEELVGKVLEIVRGYEAEPGFKRMEKVTLKVFLREELHPYCLLWEKMGMREVRRFWTMERPLHRPVDEPSPVEGVLIRPYKDPSDNGAALAAFNNSFSDHYDHHAASLEDWNHWVKSPSMRLDLSWLGEDENTPGRIVGFCICAINEAHLKRHGVREGWIDLLGTTGDHRRQGLGRALLLHGLHSLREAGLDTALLGVDSESPTGANRLYESVGFRIRNREMQYEAPLENMKA